MNYIHLYITPLYKTNHVHPIQEAAVISYPLSLLFFWETLPTCILKFFFKILNEKPKVQTECASSIELQGSDELKIILIWDILSKREKNQCSLTKLNRAMPRHSLLKQSSRLSKRNQSFKNITNPVYLMSYK